MLLLQIFIKERLNGHYGVLSFVIANTLSSLPFLCLTAIVPGTLAYILGGLHPGVDRFFYFIVSLLACLFGVEGLLMAIASLVSDFLHAMMIGSGVMVCFWGKNNSVLYGFGYLSRMPLGIRKLLGYLLCWKPVIGVPIILELREILVNIQNIGGILMFSSLFFHVKCNF